MKSTLILAAVAAGSMALNGYFLNNVRLNGQALDLCAKTQNVYACKAVAVPVTPPRVVEVAAALLPPPASMGGR